MSGPLTRKPHALLVAYGGGHITMVLPVAQILRERGWKITLLALTTAARKAEQVGIPHIEMTDLLEFCPPDVIERGLALVGRPPAGGEISPEETLIYHGIGIADLCAEHGEEEALRLFAERGRQAFLPRRFMSRMLQGMRPDVVIATNSPRAERAAILAARDVGIPAVCLVDMFALQEVEWIGQAGYADRVCVISDAVRKMFIERGRAPEEIIVTGNPAFDGIADAATAERGCALRIRRSWDDGRVNILWASTAEPARHPFTGEPGDPTLPRRVEEALRRQVAADDRLRLIVRYHPSEQIVFTPGERVEFSPLTEPLDELLHAVDVVVVTVSTVGLEAWLASKPLISLDLSIFTADAPYSRMGISAGAKTFAELEKLLTEAVGKSPRFPLSGQKPSMSKPGLAAWTIAATIENLVMPLAE